METNQTIQSIIQTCFQNILNLILKSISIKINFKLSQRNKMNCCKSWRLGVKMGRLDSTYLSLIWSILYFYCQRLILLLITSLLLRNEPDLLLSLLCKIV